jgi:hypothetical protein
LDKFWKGNEGEWYMVYFCEVNKTVRGIESLNGSYSGGRVHGNQGWWAFQANSSQTHLGVVIPEVEFISSKHESLSSNSSTTKIK